VLGSHGESTTGVRQIVGVAGQRRDFDRIARLDRQDRRNVCGKYAAMDGPGVAYQCVVRFHGAGIPAKRRPRYIAVTRVCVVDTSSGAPLGAQIDRLSCSKAGCPAIVTRLAPVTNCAVWHGPVLAGGGSKAQPVTA
jgi:hypothetical protein